MNMATKTPLRYFPKANKVRIPAKSTEYYPQYLQYLFECLKIPQNVTIVFKDKTIVGGIPEWLKE